MAGLPVLALHYLVDHRIEQEARQEVELIAKRGIRLAEGRLDRVVARLRDLDDRGIAGCSAAERDALNAMAFDSMVIKELAVVGADGETLCTNHGLELGERRLAVSHRIADSAPTFIEVLHIGDRARRLVRVRRMDQDGRRGLAALIPSELLVPQVTGSGELLHNRVRLTAPDGTTVAENGARVESAEADADPIVATVKSGRFGIEMRSSIARASLAAPRSDLRAFGILAGFGALVLIASWLASVRWRRKNPVHELRRALQADEFVPYYQPILDITNGRLEGAEVLVRWRKPDGSVVPPANFIPLLESSGLIFDVTQALMRRVCREAGPAIGCRPRCKLSFNLTARHFADRAVVDDVRGIFEASPIGLSQLVLEVTERQPLENLTAARGVIAALQALGVRVAMDDVGAGHNGLSYLLKLGVDIIKIDKLFVDAIGAERHSAAIISSLVELARTMRMDIVAEGVESFEQVAYLRDQGIRLAQGYVFAPPLPGAAFLQLLEAADPVAAPASKRTGAAAAAGTPAASRIAAA